MVKRLSATNQNSVGLNNVPTPVSAGDAANKVYIDTGLSGKVNGAGTLSTGSSAPATPSVGDVWIDPNTTSGAGNVAGAASSTDNAVARFDGTTGLTIQNSLATIDDAGKITATGLKMGATTAGYVLTADSSGNYTPQAPTGSSSTKVTNINITASSSAPASPSLNDLWIQV